MERKKALGSAYVITNKRCITFLPGWFSGPAPTSYYPDLVQHMRRMPSWIFGDGAGDIVFRSVTTVTTTYHRRGGASTSVSTTYYGFLGIRNLDEVEGRIRHALRLVAMTTTMTMTTTRMMTIAARRKRRRRKKKRVRDDDAGRQLSDATSKPASHTTYVPHVAALVPFATNSSPATIGTLAVRPGLCFSEDQ